MNFTSIVKATCTTYLKAFKVVESGYPNFKRAFFGVSVLFALTSAMAASLPYLLKKTADAFNADAEGVQLFIFFSLSYACCWIVAQVMNNIKGIFSAGVLGKSDAILMERILQRLFKTSFGFQKNADPAVISSNVARSSLAFTSLTVSFFWTLGPIVIEILIAIAFLYLAMGFLYSVLFLFSVILLVIIAVIVAVACRSIHGEIISAQNAISSYGVSRLSMMLDIRTNNAHEKEHASHRKVLDRYVETIIRANKKMGLLLSAQSMAIGVLLAVSTFSLIFYKQISQISSGDFVMIAGYIGMLTMQLRLIAGSLIDVQKNTVALELGIEYLSAATTGFETQIIQSADQSTPVYEASDLKAVTVGKELFSKLSFTINHGEFFVISAPSGFGKSTLISYMLGLDKPEEGSIFFKGSPINVSNSNSLLQSIATVPQKYGFIPGTVRENLVYGVRRDVSDEHLLKVLSELHLNLNPGSPDCSVLDRVINFQGNGFSGGELQRICIGRAIVKGGDIVILDEPTASLSEPQALEIIQLLRRTFETVVVVTHNPQIISLADRWLNLAQIAGEEKTLALN